MLKVVHTQARGRRQPRRAFALEAQPFRPNELPSSVELRIDAHVGHELVREARSAGLPVGLLLRCRVEAARQLRCACDVLEADRAEAEAALDAAATEAEASSALASADLLAYARSLLAGDRVARHHATLDERLEVLAPAELLGAWTAEAAALNLRLEEWVQRVLESAPKRAVAWEAAAARSCSYLGEWILRSLARARSARTSASPQARAW